MASSPHLLKDRAAALELRKQPEKALVVYRQLLAEFSGTEHVDVTVRNRVGDLYLRLQQINEAIALFELSADEYAQTGFLSNAIALCNKILRLRPNHVPTLRRLARLSAEKGIVVDAQRNYLFVAEALEKLGQHGEALQALEEFANLSPDDVHVRAAVVAQLLSTRHPIDALPHLTVLHRLHAAAARHEEAAAAAKTALDIDPRWVPESQRKADEKPADLPFLVLDGDFAENRDELSTVTQRVAGLERTEDVGDFTNRRSRPERRRGDRRRIPRPDNAPPPDVIL